MGTDPMSAWWSDMTGGGLAPVVPAVPATPPTTVALFPTLSGVQECHKIMDTAGTYSRISLYTNMYNLMNVKCMVI